MSDNQPPSGQPPYGPPPSQPPMQPPGWQPPQQPSTQGWPQPVDQISVGAGGGGPRSGGGGRKWAIIGGGVVAAGALVTGAAFGAAALLGGDKHDLGPQPADALPASTFAYASIDSNPSDGQVADLLGILGKFPGFTQHVSLSGGGSGDPREMIFDAIIAHEPTGSGDCALTWDNDFAPWMGTKFAAAGVAIADKPQFAVVVQVSDGDKALAEFKKFDHCFPDGSDNAGGYAVNGQWAVIGESQSAVDQITSEAKAGSLADDATYQHWIGSVGDPGLISAYAAPSAGAMLADSLGKLQSFAGSLGGSCDFSSAAGSTVEGGGVVHSSGEMPCSGDDPLGTMCPGAAGSAGILSSYETMLRGFGGAAMTVRVKDGGLESEVAMKMATASGSPASTGTDGAKLVTGLPADTSVALGLSVAPNMWESSLAGLASVCGTSIDPSQINSQLSALTGLTFPGDIDTLLGKGLALSLGTLDPATASAVGSDPSKLPLALQITGDAGGIQSVLGKVLDKISQTTGAPVGSIVGVDADGDKVAVGTDPDYRKQVLAGGDLGGDPTFKNAVPDAGKANVIAYVNLNKFDALVQQEDPRSFTDYFAPLQALGMAAWADPDQTVHEMLRITTD